MSGKLKLPANVKATLDALLGTPSLPASDATPRKLTKRERERERENRRSLKKLVERLEKKRKKGRAAPRKR
jgi:nucleotidyltransferase/DNA polymerase involved in DNA repair